jgi:histidinol-phosphate aminotransferase
MSVLDLARPDILALAPYSSARMEASGGTILLNANESPWRADFDDTPGLNRYPDPQPAQLVARLAALYGVSPEQLLVARGSDEGIDLLVRTFCRAGKDAVAICPPTFGMYAVSAAVQGAYVVEIPLKPDFSIDSDALIACTDARVKIVFLCTPNNPTGDLVPIEQIERLALSFASRALIVVDEAYIEFANAPSATGLLASHDNVVVLRTLSKAHALAGARVGSVIAHPDIIALLRRILPAYPLPTSCIRSGIAALSSNAIAATDARVTALIEGRNRLASLLQGLPEIIEVFPSAANFLLLRCDDADAFYQRLLARGIVVRNVSKQRSLSGCLRVSIGTEREIQSLIRAIGIREASV